MGDRPGRQGGAGQGEAGGGLEPLPGVPGSQRLLAPSIWGSEDKGARQGEEALRLGDLPHRPSTQAERLARQSPQARGWGRACPPSPGPASQAGGPLAGTCSAGKAFALSAGSDPLQASAKPQPLLPTRPCSPLPLASRAAAQGPAWLWIARSGLPAHLHSGAACCPLVVRAGPASRRCADFTGTFSTVCPLSSSLNPVRQGRSPPLYTRSPGHMGRVEWQGPPLRGPPLSLGWQEGGGSSPAMGFCASVSPSVTSRLSGSHNP